MNPDRKKYILRKIIRKIIERELAEISTTSATPGYLTPMAFKKKKKKKKHEVSEGRYHTFRNDPDRTPRQKIGITIREIKKSLKEVNRQTAILKRYKTESGQNYDSYWKRTSKDIQVIESEILKLSRNLRELRK